jgi:hypothetical protein
MEHEIERKACGHYETSKTIGLADGGYGDTACSAGTLVLILLACRRTQYVAQPDGHLAFADQRSLWGMPYAMDVLSNAPFALLGAWGLLRLRSVHTPPARRNGFVALVPCDAQRPLAQLFFVGLLLTALCSSYYHLQPNDLGADHRPHGHAGGICRADGPVCSRPHQRTGRPMDRRCGAGPRSRGPGRMGNDRQPASLVGVHPNQFALLRQRRFAPFFWTQFSGAANDNLFKFAFTVMVTYQLQRGVAAPGHGGAGDRGAVHTAVPAVFGHQRAAGRQVRQAVLIRFVKRLEMAIMALAAYGFFSNGTCRGAAGLHLFDGRALHPVRPGQICLPAPGT